MLVFHLIQQLDYCLAWWQTLSKFEVDNQLNPKFDTGAFRFELQKIEAF